MSEILKVHPEDPSVWILELEQYVQCPVYIYVPDSCSPDRPAGLFFFMHGGDSSSPPVQPYRNYIGKDTGVLRDHLVNFPYITVAPAALPAVDGKRWNRKGVSVFILDVIRAVQAHFNVDGDRMILGGHSMGGFGAYHQGALLAEHFAGIWCSAGAWLREDFRAMEGTGIYLSHGKYDCASHYRGAHCEPRHHSWCGVSFARAAHELMNRYGISHMYDEHEGGHTLDWEPCQMAFCRFLQWAQRQKRNPYPPRCCIMTPNGSCDPDLEEKLSCRYLQITETDPAGTVMMDRIVLTGPDIAWTIDEFNAQSYYLEKAEQTGAFLQVENRSDNLFTVTSRNVREFILYLHPVMADLSKPIRLVIDQGEETVMKAQEDHSRKDYCASVTVRI